MTRLPPRAAMLINTARCSSFSVVQPWLTFTKKGAPDPSKNPPGMKRPMGFKAWLQVVRCYQKGLRRLSERLSPLDLTSAQLDVLANLFAGPEEGLTQEQLSQRLLVTKGNVSGLLDRLSQRGWV